MKSDFVWKLVEKLKRPMGLFLILVLTSVMQYIFDMHFACSCQHHHYRNIVLYIIFPPLILTLALFIVKTFYKKRFFSTVNCCTEKCCTEKCCTEKCCTKKCCTEKCCTKNCCTEKCCTEKCNYWTFVFLGKKSFEYICPAVLWTTLVLFDGDWYFCLMTNFNSDQTGLPCKKGLTYEEERIKNSYKTESLDIGLGLCCILLIIWCIVEAIQKRSSLNCCPRQTPYFEAKYQKILSEEISIYIEENLKQIAKTKAEEMCKPKIEVIRNSDVSQNVSQAWEDISDPKFLLKYPQEMTRNNPQIENKKSDPSETPGTPQEGQEEPNLETAQDSVSSPLMTSSSPPLSPSSKEEICMTVRQKK